MRKGTPGETKNGATQPGGFEEELARQTLMSERHRSLILMAVFVAPISHGVDCLDAVAATRRILLEVKMLEMSGKLPPTQVGLALHAGEAIVGNVGCDERKEYTVIGDVVNVAFRIEALNKEFGSAALISEPVRKAAAVNGLESIAPIPIRGRSEPVQLYRLA